MASFKAYVQIVVRDENGKVVSRQKKACRSFTIAFLQLLNALMKNSAAISITDTGNTARNMCYTAGTGYYGYTFFNNKGVDDDDSMGVVVGTGNTAETNTDYALGTQIAHGSGAGQLDYGANSYTDAQVVGANVDLKIERTFTNSSGGAITIEEVGIYVHSRDSAAATRVFLVMRDTTGGTAVANGQTATVTYTWRTTV